MPPEAIRVRLLPAALGFERRLHCWPNTNGIARIMLVAVGTTMYMVLAHYEGSREHGTISQMIQDGMDGFGFLAGAMNVTEATSVRGIKTVATIGITSAIGLATGTGRGSSA